MIENTNKSQLTSNMIELLYPFIMVFGLYIIINGHNTPGGGFQGGAIFSAIFIGRYLVLGSFNFNMSFLQVTEKLVYIFIVALSCFVMFLPMRGILFGNSQVYLLMMNFFIGAKVFCGLSIIFLRFALYENV